ncbi:hypothetical protein KAFR_0H00950 [Kazachstania africana CBS 2517]|uniref:HMG box domain-containing protein n=1 Tax=Kazachstania africana (strain ATCC 22294 / BCRC 22015 / CBS 2517 / CECT 1963 / NBRC 1671 / NRRL Y-8276) TaxID=1071382 RepID=H2AYU9_KAZAF|nr:hypothetical protein KAFR_0H00950 [Kazachstania africana CBS 2517]CCF59505.1 hypothetical protein KAFR_0H00950 [Kazachstania africana CBS 2517]
MDNNSVRNSNNHQRAKIPRPRNAFILFRQHYHKILMDEWTATGVDIPHNSKISKILGNKWKTISPNEKLHWEELAKKEKLGHERKYPEYKYRPVRKNKKRVSHNDHPLVNMPPTPVFPSSNDDFFNNPFNFNRLMSPPQTFISNFNYPPLSMSAGQPMMRKDSQNNNNSNNNNNNNNNGKNSSKSNSSNNNNNPIMTRPVTMSSGYDSFSNSLQFAYLNGRQQNLIPIPLSMATPMKSNGSISNINSNFNNDEHFKPVQFLSTYHSFAQPTPQDYEQKLLFSSSIPGTNNNSQYIPKSSINQLDSNQMILPSISGNSSNNNNNSNSFNSDFPSDHSHHYSHSNFLFNSHPPPNSTTIYRDSFMSTNNNSVKSNSNINMGYSTTQQNFDNNDHSTLYKSGTN